MSKFFRAQDSSSEEDGSSESESDNEVRQVGGKFQAAFDSDSDSEDEARVVQSHKDRAWDSMKDCLGRIRNAKKNNDWNIIQEQFDELNKTVDKSKMLILKNGLPKFYVKGLADTEDFLSAALKDKEAIKKMSKKNSAALNRMKLGLRKHNQAALQNLFRHS